MLIYYLCINTPVPLAAESSQRQNGNKYVGFSQQASGLGRLGGSYPQNQLRQASAQSSSFNRDTAIGSGYSQGLSRSGYAQALSQPAQSGRTSVRVVKSSSLSKPNWRGTKLNQVKAQEAPKQNFGLSTSIASGSSVSKYSQKQNVLPDISKRGTWPVQQGMPHANNYLSSSSASIQSPSSKSKSASHQSAAQNVPGAAAETLAFYGRTGYSPMKSSSLFGPRAPVQMKTSASAPARRVTSHRSSQFPAPQSKPFHVNGGYHEGYKPSSTSSMTSSHLSYSPSLPMSNKQNAHVSFGPEMPTREGLSYKPSYTSTGQIPSNTNSHQVSSNSRNMAQGAGSLPASGNSRSGASGRRFAPTIIHSIPERFGGFAIRRLQTPADQREASVKKPQQTYTAPSRQRDSSRLQGQSVHPEGKRMRIRPSGRPAGEYLITFCCSVLMPCF